MHTANDQEPCKKVRGPIQARYLVPYPSLQYPGCAYDCTIKLVRPRQDTKKDRFYVVGPPWRGNEVQYLRAYGGSRRWAFWVLLSFTGEVVAVNLEAGYPLPSPVTTVNNVLYAHTGYVAMYLLVSFSSTHTLMYVFDRYVCAIMTIEMSEEAVVPDVRLFTEMHCATPSDEINSFEREFVTETKTKDGRFKMYLPQHYTDLRDLKPENLEGIPRALDGVRHKLMSW